ncbi:MAG: hypothetical protein ACE15C_02705 [Phycisphaerae bacterium]
MAIGFWTEGVSKTSIGRFGGYRDDCIPYDDGYLTCGATAVDVFLERRDDLKEDLGHYLLPPNFRQKTRSTWTLKRYDFRLASGVSHSTVFRSLLFPGFLHRVKTGRFEYYWRLRNYGATDLVLPLADGLKHVRGTAGYDRQRDGDLTRPWVLFYFSRSAMPFDYPMLLVFDKQPEKIEVWTHEYLKVHFKDRKATVVQVHPFGAQRLDKEATKAWAAGLPEDVAAKMDFWAAAAMNYPVACKETYRVDEKQGVVRIRDEYSYERSKCAWPVKPVELAPLPPILANARHCGYPVKMSGKLLEKLCPTFMGWYEAVPGSTIEYELPLSRFRNHVLAPMMVKNDPTADEVTAKLTEYLESGDYRTFGGDDHYDPSTSLDSLHDLRIMAWALWSIDPEKRAKVLELLTRGLGNFDFKEFLRYRTPVTGTPWARHKTIFDYLGEIDYDMEWYNGMNLAGLWAWAYFGQDPKADEFLRRHWTLAQEINAYSLAYTDWAQQTAWTCCRGEATWLDGINYAYEGMLGYAAMARRLGKRKDAQLGDYLAAKCEAFIHNCWMGSSYAQEFFAYEGAKPGCMGGFYEGRGPRYGEASGWPCGTYSYFVREVFMLLSDLGLQDALRQELDNFTRNFPNWRTDPYSYGKATNYPGSDYRRTVHHYSLDPRLAVCALVLGEDASSLLKLQGAPLTGPVLETMLVAMAPRVLVPRDVTFQGCVWDAAARKLTVTLAGKGRTTIGLAHSDAPCAVRADKLLTTGQSPGRMWFTIKLAGRTEIVFEFGSGPST